MTPSTQQPVTLDLPWRHVWVGDGFLAPNGEVWEVADLQWHDDRLQVTGRRRARGEDGARLVDEARGPIYHTYEDEVNPDRQVRVVWVKADTMEERAAIFELQKQFTVSPVWRS